MKYIAIALLILPIFFTKPINASESEYKTLVYFTGIGCPHCAEVSPFLHEEVSKNSNIILFEYEIYKNTNNSKTMYAYSNKYLFNLGIPLLIYNNDLHRQGDTDITNNYTQDIQEASTNILTSENPQELESLDFNKLEGFPIITRQNRVLVKETTGELSAEQNEILRQFLLAEDLNAYVKTIEGEKIETLTINHPGIDSTYEKGIKIGNWNILWNGSDPKGYTSSTQVNNTTDQTSTKESLTLGKLIMLALTDSINPCALSVLLMMLIAIVTYNPKDRKQILLSGLAFVLAVFLTYLIYGILIVKAFQLIQSISFIRLYLYKGLAIGSIILGLLELKDFFFYKPGSFGTEMPMSFRGKVQKILAKVTSPIGAFGLGMFVTLFLLPCTIGPYIILGGILSSNELLQGIPSLLLYNLIFVLPMIFIVISIFLGTKNIKEVSKWKDKNIKIIHLITGILFTLLGLTMLFGLI